MGTTRAAWSKLSGLASRIRRVSSIFPQTAMCSCLVAACLNFSLPLGSLKPAQAQGPNSQTPPATAAPDALVAARESSVPGIEQELQRTKSKVTNPDLTDKLRHHPTAAHNDSREKAAGIGFYALISDPDHTKVTVSGTRVSMTTERVSWLVQLDGNGKVISRPVVLQDAPVQVSGDFATRRCFGLVKEGIVERRFVQIDPVTGKNKRIKLPGPIPKDLRGIAYDSGTNSVYFAGYASAKDEYLYRYDLATNRSQVLGRLPSNPCGVGLTPAVRGGVLYMIEVGGTEPGHGFFLDRIFKLSLKGTTLQTLKLDHRMPVPDGGCTIQVQDPQLIAAGDWLVTLVPEIGALNHRRDDDNNVMHYALTLIDPVSGHIINESPIGVHVPAT